MASSQTYERHKERARRRSRRETLSGQDIGAIPPVVDHARRAQADGSFRFFCEVYFPDLFYFDWSPDHLRVIELMELTVLRHETFAVAMPRGSGKTTLCKCAVLWAILTGRHQFVILVAATGADALDLLADIKRMIADNDLLLDDYPEVCYPIRKLEGESRRCSGQRYLGKRTYVEWKSDELVLATIPGARSSGAIIRVAGIKGKIRGATYQRLDGSLVRPTLAIVDDPQTDESARSWTMTTDRLKIIKRAIGRLAPPGKQTGVIVPCTVIEAGDLADQLLDRCLNPTWQGERTKTIYVMPENMELWDEYDRLRRDAIEQGASLQDARAKCNAYYEERREKMDAGAKVAWADNYDREKYLSALQAALEVKFADPETFAAELQNEPLRQEAQSDLLVLDVRRITSQTNGIPRGVVPLSCEYLTAFVDVQARMLFYLVVAWESNLTGYVIDYGAHPDQGGGLFTYASASHTLQRLYGVGPNAAILAGLNDLVERLLGTDYLREDGAKMSVGACAVDSGWKTQHIYTFCRRAGYGGRLLPSCGFPIGPAHKPMSEWKKKAGDRAGLHWRLQAATPNRPRLLLIDVNWWKSAVYEALAVGYGDPGSITLWGNNGVREHRMFADHILAERRSRTSGMGRTVDIWKDRPGHPDNHWKDCLVGNGALATYLGCKPTGIDTPGVRPKKRISLAALYQQKRR